jgi:NAD binding domain of 6-phosphogluconate dehydrogenase
VKIFGPDNQELIAISAIERDGAELVLRGKIFGTLPMSAPHTAGGGTPRPEAARLADGRVCIQPSVAPRALTEAAVTSMPEQFLPPERIGFIGLGNMGAQMARHLAAAGYQVVAADASPAALERFAGSIPCERVHTRIGWVVLASDAAHYLANTSSGRPFPIVADAMQTSAGWERMKVLASRPEYIVPGHDPLVMQRYSEPEPRLRGLAVRLDAVPQEVSHGTPQR